MRMLLRRLLFMCFIFIQFIIFYLLINNSENIKNVFKVFSQKFVNKTICEIGIDLNDDMIQLLSTSTKLGIKLFIVEPQRLVKYLNEEELVFLEKSDSTTVIENNFEPDKIILGVFEFNLKTDQTSKLVGELDLDGFKCLNAISGQSKDKDKNVYRYLCTKANTKIHIIKFIKRNDFYVIKEISNALVYTGKYFTNESQFESAFDTFELQQCNSNGIKWYLPKQLKQFLAQTKTSRFNECDKELINFSKKFTDDSGGHQRKFKHSKEEIELTKIAKIDQNCENSKILIFVYSSPTISGEYFDRRQAARKTWIPEAIKSNIKVFFVVAEPRDNEVQNQLESEAIKHKDLIQFGFKDSYYNRTLKDIAVFHWIENKCFYSKYIMKSDDNIIINIKHLLNNLQNFKSGITGCLMHQLKPVRDINSQWFIPKCLFPDTNYPQYLRGSSYLMTADIVKALNEALEQYSGPFIDMEDVFITGIIAEKAQIKRYGDQEFQVGQCSTSIDICFMFDTIVLMDCSTANDIVMFWNKWKSTTTDSCGFPSISL